tara:strand:- start:10 stop:1374 length:1365 start_codon:yes stop_codon:yes gene_type:complete
MTSKIKVNTVTTESGSTLTLGESGKTVAIASGASTTGMGRAGAVDWQTSIKTSGFTAVSGEGYFCNTTSGGFTLTLPASPSSGDIVAFKDYANTFDTGNLTIGRNGSNIGGQALDSNIETEGIAITLVYADATKGWLVTESGLQDEAPGPEFVTATGGTTITSGNFKTHIFTGPGTFCVSAAGNSTGSNTVDYFVVAGGGAAQGDRGAGGGAGGFRLSNSVGCVPAPTMSPLANPTGIPVSVQGFPITVGAGGAIGSPPTADGSPGANSIFSSITSAGGGGSKTSTGTNGGSGAGGYDNPGGSGNTPPVSPPQGNDGGNGAGGPSHGAGGGGGAGAAGSNGTTGGTGGAGGAGSFLADTVIGPTAPSFGEGGPVSNTRYFAGGGGGSFYGDPGPGTPGPGGIGGGGNGANCFPGNGESGATNTGGGGGGGVQRSGPGTGGTGGSGIVIIRYKFQ